MRQACGAGLHAEVAGPPRSSWALVMTPRSTQTSLTGKWVALALPRDQVTQRRAERVPWGVSLQPLIACLVRKAWLDAMADLARGLTL